MSPEHGARLELRRLEIDGEGAADARVIGAAYDARVLLREASFGGRAEIAADGAVGFAWSDGTPPEWCLTALRAQLRTLFRERASRGYPRRVTRWRAEPTMSSGPPEAAAAARSSGPPEAAAADAEGES